VANQQRSLHSTNLPENLIKTTTSALKDTIMGGQPAATAESQYPVLSAKPVGQRISRIYKERIDSFSAGGQYQSKNLRS
jgi:hypothetical protein